MRPRRLFSSQAGSQNMSSTRTVGCALSSARMSPPAICRRFRTDTAAQPLRGRCDSTSRRNTGPRRISRPAMFRPLSFLLRSWHHHPEEIRNILSARFQPEAFALRHFFGPPPGRHPAGRLAPARFLVPAGAKRNAIERDSAGDRFLRHRSRLADNVHSRDDNAYGETLRAAPAARPHDGGGNGARLLAGRTQGRSLAGCATDRCGRPTAAFP